MNENSKVVFDLFIYLLYTLVHRHFPFHYFSKACLLCMTVEHAVSLSEFSGMAGT